MGVAYIDNIYHCIGAFESFINALLNKIFVFRNSDVSNCPTAAFDIYHYLYNELRWSLIDKNSNRVINDKFSVKTFINLHIIYKPKV